MSFVNKWHNKKFTLYIGFDDVRVLQVIVCGFKTSYLIGGKSMKRFIIIMLTSVLLFSLAACGSGEEADGNTVIVSGKKFTEQIILAHLLGEYLKENTDLNVVMKEDLGGVVALQEAITTDKKNKIDTYIEYSGTAFEVVLDQDFEADMTPEEVFEITKTEYEEQFGVTWLDPLGFNNTYSIAMGDELYEELGITTFTELGEHAKDISFGGSSEFFERDDGYDGLVEAYDYDEFGKKVSLDPDLLYIAADNREVDIISAFATDARIDEYNLTLLEDDKGFFPPYDASIIIRQEILDENPGLAETLSKLSGIFTDEKMRALNGKVNLDGQDEKEAAIEFLKDEGLID